MEAVPVGSVSVNWTDAFTLDRGLVYGISPALTVVIGTGGPLPAGDGRPIEGAIVLVVGLSEDVTIPVDAFVDGLIDTDCVLLLLIADAVLLREVIVFEGDALFGIFGYKL